MLKSMTAFASISRDFDWGTLSVELSTVNHRYQDISVRMPRELSSLEPQVHEMLRKSLKRGKIRAKVEINLSTFLKAVPFNRDVLIKYYQELEDIKRELKMIEDIRIEDLLNLPGVLQSDGVTESFLQKVSESIYEVLSKGINKLIYMREQEGEDIKRDFLQNLEGYKKNISQIEQVWEGAKNEAVENLKVRIKQVIEDKNLFQDETRLAQEVAIMADKWDISEELSRTWSHVEKLAMTIDSDDTVGRKLDFLIQEMNREINTIASKVNDSQIRWLVVESKTFLERIREQVQNVE